jgi:tetratricopeptide (TPR) repeat protein
MGEVAPAASGLSHPQLAAVLAQATRDLERDGFDAVPGIRETLRALPPFPDQEPLAQLLAALANAWDRPPASTRGPLGLGVPLDACRDPELCRWRTEALMRLIHASYAAARSHLSMVLLASTQPHVLACPACGPYTVALLNLSVGVFAAAGLFTPAGQAGELALTLIEDGHPLRLHVLSGLRNAYGLGRMYEQARNANARLLAEFSARGQPLPLSEVFNQASLSIDLGEFGQAEQWLARYVRETLSEPLSGDFHHLYGHCMSNLGRTAEAIGAYRKAYDLETAAGRPGLAAESYQNLGGIYNELGAYRESERYLREAIRLFQVAGRYSKAAATMINLGNTLKEEHRFREADDLYARAAALHAGIGDRPRAANATLMRAQIAFFGTGNTQAASTLLEEASGMLSVEDGSPEYGAGMMALRSDLSLEAGEVQRGREQAEAAVRIADAALATTADPFTRSFLAATRFDAAFDQLIQALVATGDVRAAFETHERNKPASHFGEARSFSATGFQQVLGRVSPAPLVVSVSRARNHAGWRVTETELSMLPQPHPALLPSALEEFYAAVFEGEEPPESAVASVSETLGAYCRENIAAAEGQPVFVVTSHPWGITPWAAAQVDGTRFFLDGSRGPFLAGVCPSAVLLERCLDAHPQMQNRRALVVGNPGGLDDDPLPEALREGSACGALLEQCGWEVIHLAGAEATKHAVLQTLREWRPAVLLLATHARVSHVDPRHSSIWLGGDGQQGWLQVGELMEEPALVEPLRVVWLNACETGMQAGLQANSQLSIASAFLSLGVPCVVGNLWSVYDDSALALALTSFARMAEGAPVAVAVRDAQAALASGEVRSIGDLGKWSRRRGSPNADALAKVASTLPPQASEGELRNPIHWAGLQVVGNGLIRLNDVVEPGLVG